MHRPRRGSADSNVTDSHPLYIDEVNTVRSRHTAQCFVSKRFPPEVSTAVNLSSSVQSDVGSIVRVNKRRISARFEGSELEMRQTMIVYCNAPGDCDHSR